MRRIYIFISIIIVCIFVSGCDGNVTRTIRHAGFTIDGDFTCDVVMPTDKKDTSYANIRYMTDGLMILEDGTIYELSLGQKYANKQNCKIADTSKKVVSIFDDKYFKSNDDRYYYLSNKQDDSSYKEVPKTDNTYILIDLLLKDATNVKIVSGNSSSGEYYALKSNGNIYKYIITRDNSTRVETITSTTLVFDKKDYGGSKIIDFNYAGESLNTFIKTSDKVYRMKVSNAEKCNKYADITCKYKLMEDELFLEYGDRIIFFNGKYLITDYGKKFNVAF